MTFEQLVALLTPSPNGTLSVAGGAFETPHVTTLFDLCFANGTMVVTGATSVAEDPVVVVTGTLAPSTFLSITRATLTRGVFRLLDDGSVAVTLDVRVDDASWTLSQSFPTLDGSIFDQLTYADAAFTLDSQSPPLFPPDYRATFGYPANNALLAASVIRGLSFRANTGFTGSLAFLSGLIQPPIPVAGPIEVFLQFNLDERKNLVMPQLLLDTSAEGRTRHTGDYDFTFAVQIASLFQEFPSDDSLTVAVIPTGVVAVRTNFAVSGFDPIPVSMYVYQGNRGRLVFNVGNLVSVPVTEEGLPQFLNGASPGNQLHPGFGFPGFDILVIDGVSLTMQLEPFSLDSIALAASIGRGKEWTLFGGLLTIDQITFTIGTTFRRSSATVSVSIEGAGYLANNPGIALATSVILGTTTLAFEASLEQTTELDLTAIVKSLIGNAIDLPVITGSTFSISGNVALSSYMFETKIQQEWAIFGTLENGLVLREIGLNLGSDDGIVHGGVYGILLLAGVPVYLSATYDPSGWVFSGSTEPGQRLNLTDLFADLFRVFGVELPPGLPAILLDELRVIYSTETGRFALDAALAIPAATYNLADLPLIGKWLDPSDRIWLERITIALETGGTESSIVDFGFLVGFGTNNTVSVVIPLAGQKATPTKPPPPDRPITYPADGTGEPVPAQRSFGPLLVQKLSFIVDDAGIGVKFDASLAVSGVLIETQGLGMIVRLTEPFLPAFRLDGLAVSYSSPTLSFGGALVRVPKPEFMQFDGVVVVKAKKFGISAFASYATSDPASMFLFAMVHAPIGGPPVFFINGFSGGFGFNRSLILPKLAEVPKYPLVAGATIASSPFGKDPTLTDFVRVMDKYMPVATGEYWAAAGIAVQSFGMLQSQLLLTIAWGTRFQVGLIGLSTLSIPPAVKQPLARAQLAMEAVFLPDDGLIAVAAQLTPSSYVFEPECVLSGGFAFYLWFSPSTFDGDFVVTLGGYNPYYKVPAHYPDVPQLGMNWKVLGSPLVIKGGAYFALTPHAIMAGGFMNATWTVPAITVWFSVSADFLIQWKPFHYDIRAGVSFGVRLTLQLGIIRITLSITIGAALAIWGPPFSGTATINLAVFSFTIHFGESRKNKLPPPIDWAEFKQSFLPEPRAVVRALFAEGLQLDLTGKNAIVGYTVDPQRLQLYIQTVIPAKSATVNGLTLGEHNRGFGINPMSVAVEKLASALTIELTRSGARYDDIEVAIDASPAPKALWLPDPAPQRTLNADPLLDDLAQGLTIVPHPAEPAHSLPIEIETLLYSPEGTEEMRWGANVEPHENPYEHLDPWTTLTATIDTPPASNARRDIVANLIYSGFRVSPNGNAAPLTNADALGLLDPPVLSPLGENDAAA